jgi:hypothetical protein
MLPGAATRGGEEKDRAPRYLGLVHGYDQKPKRRLVEVLREQGLQAN